MLSILRCFAAEHFGDVTVAPQSLGSGETFHGYREFRVLLRNESLKDAHRVTLIYPDRPFGYGNSINRISRTVVLGPASQAIVPLWQPPLPANGSGTYRVLVDDEDVGTVPVPDVPRHMSRVGIRYSGGSAPATVLISRGINYDEVTRALKSDRAGFSAKMATGPPDSSGRSGMIPTAWTPDTSKPGPHWIELDYDKPMAADRVRLYETMAFSSAGEINLTGVSGTNVGRITISGTTGAPTRSRRPGAVREFPLPLTPEPVKTVRVDFGTTFAGAIGIDAVELAGPSGSTWASAARASSEAPAGRSPYGGPGIPGSEPLQTIRSESPVSEWSDAWLSYSPYDAILLSVTDVRGAPPAVLAALWRYAECGGNLVLFGDGAIPEPWRDSVKTNLENGRCFNVGFGQCFVFKDEPQSMQPAPEMLPITSPAPDMKLIMDSANASARYWQSLPDENGANTSFPVIENFRIPVRGTVFIMLAFVILIGPVNIIVCSRLKRRTWLLWTIPAISFATCLIVFTYSLLREGVTPDVRIDGLTLLDQVNRRATSLGMTAFYCPLTPSQGLFFDSDTEATPLVETWDYRYGGRNGSPREVDWTQSQHLGRGWVMARVPAYFQLRKSETRRERLQIENDNGHLAIVNGLGARIHLLCLADDSGRIFTASNIAAGQRQTLSPSVQFPKLTDQRGPKAFHEAFPVSERDDVLHSNAANYLLPNTYIAELETNPFLENALGPRAKSSRTKSRSVVFGILERPEQPQTSAR